MAEPIETFRVKLEKILELRHRVLRERLPLESAHFEGDNDDTTWHIMTCISVACMTEHVPRCCASFMLTEFPELSGCTEFKGRPAYQLRGMATEPSFQGRGEGRQLLAWAERMISWSSGVSLFWCNARKSAVGFYKKQGWEVVSDEFEIEGVGPHYKMKKIWQAA